MLGRSIIAAAAVVLAAGGAKAELSGPYLGLGVMGQYQSDRTVAGAAAGSLDMQLGYGGNGVAGYQFDNGIRIEGELAYRRNGADQFNNANSDGNLNSFGLMGNFIWEYDNPSGIYPYIGAGMGGARVSASDFSNLGGAALNDSDVVLAYQGLAGVAFALNPNLSLIAEYKYFRTSEAEFRNANNARVTIDYATHSATVGLRYRFGTAPAAAGQSSVQQAALPVVSRARPPRRIAKVVPKPAPLPVAQAKAAASLRRTYVVYFGLNRDDLSPEARRTVADASTQAKTDGTAVIELAGHTDRSGDAAYNIDLSKRRAANTAAEIQRNGVRSRLKIKGYGEAIPKIVTADGKYEPRNRRVEVVLQGKGDGISN
jgi:OOP family OmpA-OmpF porin